MQLCVSADTFEAARPSDVERGFSIVVIRPRWEAWGMLNARVDGLGVRRVFLDSAEAVVRANEALDTCRPSRAARTDPGFRLPTAGDE